MEFLRNKLLALKDTTIDKKYPYYRDYDLKIEFW